MCKMQSNLDEELIKEVEQHAVIYNRQKYFVNNSGAGQFETKDDAWDTIAKKLSSDVETCKKRWKYLRERYVQQLKNYPPTFEHLSRPYLERMKFLDQHIQPRKSFRNVFLPSPKQSQYVEYMDSRSNGSLHNNYSNYPESVSSSIKVEPTFPNFHPSDDPSANGHRSVSQPSLLTSSGKSNEQVQNLSTPSASEVRENADPLVRIPSSSSSLKSPLSSPPQVGEHHQHNNHHHEEMNENMKRARLAMSSSQRRNDSSDDDMVPSRLNLQRHLERQQEQHQILLNDTIKRTNFHAESSQMTNSDLMHSFYQRFAPSSQVRCSEQLLGELVTSELLKMSKEKRKIAQRRILEILFFDD